MIVFPPEWSQHVGAHLVTAYPPGGGRHRCFERLRPAPDFAAILDMILAGDRAFTVTSVDATLKIVTHEGEYGAWVRLHGTRDSAAEQRFIGAIFSEDFAVALDTLAADPAQFGELADRSLQLLRSATLGLGPRRRLFMYAPPPGWQPLPSGLVATWYPPDYPRNHTSIVVQPALPVTAAAKDIVEDYFHQAGTGLHVETSTRAPITSEAGVAGSYFRLHGTRSGAPAPIFRDVAVFVNAQHVYAFRLETTSPERLVEARAIFGTVAASFRPLPTRHERLTGHAFLSALPDHRPG